MQFSLNGILTSKDASRKSLTMMSIKPAKLHKQPINLFAFQIQFFSFLLFVSRLILNCIQIIHQTARDEESIQPHNARNEMFSYSYLVLSALFSNSASTIVVENLPNFGCLNSEIKGAKVMKIIRTALM